MFVESSSTRSPALAAMPGLVASNHLHIMVVSALSGPWNIDTMKIISRFVTDARTALAVLSIQNCLLNQWLEGNLTRTPRV